MNKELLDKAMQLLRLQTVYLRDSVLHVSSHFDAASYDPSVYERQSYRNATKAKVFDPNESSFGRKTDDLWIYKFYYDFGTRLWRNDSEVVNEEDSNVLDDNILVEITATFEVTYFSKDEVSEESITEFMKCHVGFNAWPYWREFVHNNCSRIGMVPPIFIPQYRIPKNDGLSEQNFDSLSDLN